MSAMQNGIRKGVSAMREYRIWCGMKTRCNNPKRNNYAAYGGRGIKVCQRWSESFENFLADMGPCPPGYSIERVNNDGDYEPSNCKWASASEQAKNRSGFCVPITVNGVTKLASEWAREAGVSQSSIHERMARGRTGEALVGPRKTSRNITHNGRTQSATAWARELGINYNTFIHRVENPRMTEDRLFARKNLRTGVEI